MSAACLTFVEALEKYRPDQPRDERGRWVNEGGGGSETTRNPRVRFTGGGGRDDSGARDDYNRLSQRVHDKMRRKDIEALKRDIASKVRELRRLNRASAASEMWTGRRPRPPYSEVAIQSFISLHRVVAAIKPYRAPSKSRRKPSPWDAIIAAQMRTPISGGRGPADTFARKRDSFGTSTGIGGLRREAKAAADDLVAPIRSLSRREQIAVAEVLITSFVDQIKALSQTTKAYDPSQPRAPAGTPEGGQWTAGAVAGAVVRGTGRFAGAAGKMVLTAAQEALSTVTLIPSSKRTVGEALKDWWGRFTSSDTTTHVVAVQEAATRIMFTIILGAAALALARAFIGGAAGAVGAAVGQALRVLLGR